MGNADVDMRTAGFALIVFAVLVLTGAQLLIKSRLSVHGVVPINGELLRYVLALLADWQVWLGGAGLVISSLCWYAAISRLPLSIAYPFAALSYPAVLIGSALLLGEPFHWQAVAGNALVVLGILLIATAA